MCCRRFFYGFDPRLYRPAHHRNITKLPAQNRDRRVGASRLLDGCLSINEAELWHGRLPSFDNRSAEERFGSQSHVSDVTV
jgi:hypothetical protein